jgi:D-xylose transport system substrate-binding protein
VVQGKQMVTVYKPIRNIATAAATAAVAMLKGAEISGVNAQIDNGKIKVPTVFLDPIAVTKDNIDATVIGDGYHARDAVYQQ